MTTLRTNILSNYAGQFWSTVMSVAFLPLYIRILGMEAFGLVGLMLSFQAILQLFDFGVGGATNRELSRRIHEPAFLDRARDLVRTGEVLLWFLTLVAGLLFWISSGLLSDHWLHLDKLGRDETSQALQIMGLAIALFWPSTFYVNCLSGLEQQPVLNLINAAFATLRSVGATLILLWVSPTISAFFWWYAVVAAAQSITTGIVVWQKLPKGSRPAEWSPDELRGNGRFATGLFAIGVLALVVSQIDRLILTSLRPIAELGAYTLALSIASSLSRIVQPMFNALYPRFSRLVRDGDEGALRELYNLSNQHLAVIVASTATVLTLFSTHVLYLWTGDTAITNKVALTMSILVAGSALNGLMNVPYALQLAYGWTQLALFLNVTLLALSIPVGIWLIRDYGTLGAAMLWLVSNVFLLLVGLPLMHRRLLKGELPPWYRRDILPPVVASIVTALLLSPVAPAPSRSIYCAAWLCMTSALVLTAATLSSEGARKSLIGALRKAQQLA